MQRPSQKKLVSLDEFAMFVETDLISGYFQGDIMKSDGHKYDCIGVWSGTRCKLLEPWQCRGGVT
jgi:hypothetical protein